MNYTPLLLISLLAASSACNQDSSTEFPPNPVVAVDSCKLNVDVDTVRFQNTLTRCQARQLFYYRNQEEDYARIADTARVALRFVWWRSFHGLTMIRLENRPVVEVADSSGQRKLLQEWFVLYKADISVLNRDFSVRQGNKYAGKVPPFVFQQEVKMLPANREPAVLASLNGIGFWQMKHDYPAPAHIDGSSWSLQVYRNGQYQEVTTDRRNHPIKDVCLQLLKLSGHAIKPEEIY